MAAPRHVLLELDEQGDLHSVGEESDAEERRDSGEGRLRHRGAATAAGATRMPKTGRATAAESKTGRAIAEYEIYELCPR